MPDRLAVIFGSGFDDLFRGRSGPVPITEYGHASAPVLDIPIGKSVVAGLPRHGMENDIPAHAVNYRANVAVLRDRGVTRIVGLNTVGVITGQREPGQVAIPTQILDYTWGRAHTFHDGGVSGLRHIDFTVPFSADLCATLSSAATAAGVDCPVGGVYAATQGPRLETAAEVNRLDRDGADFVGMTAMPEAALAAEAGIDYACIALVVNPAAGRGTRPIHEAVAAYSADARRSALSIIDQLIAGAPTT